MSQSLLFCAKIPKMSSDVQERIKSDVRPQGAVLGGKSSEQYLSKQVGEDGDIFPNPPAVKKI